MWRPQERLRWQASSYGKLSGLLRGDMGPEIGHQKQPLDFFPATFRGFLEPHQQLRRSLRIKLHQPLLQLPGRPGLFGRIVSRSQPGVAGQGLPTPGCALGDEGGPVTLVQPAPSQVLRVSALRRFGVARPGIEQVAPQPQVGVELLDIQRRQGFAAFGAGGNRQLVLVQVRQLAVQAVVTARAKPLRAVAAVAVLRAQVELDRQLQVMHAFAVAQQHVQFTEGVPLTADRQVGRQQFHPRRMLHGKLPEAFVVQAQAPGPTLIQPVAQGAVVQILASQPVGQQLWRQHPVAAGQGVALWPGRMAEHRRREDDPGEVADFRLTQLAGEAEQIREQEHLASIDANLCRSR